MWQHGLVLGSRLVENLAGLKLEYLVGCRKKQLNRVPVR